MPSLVSGLPVTAACLDVPDGLDLALANAEALAVQIHGGAAVGGEHLAAVADLDVGRVGLDLGVFLGETEDLARRCAASSTGMPKSLEIALLPALRTYQPGRLVCTVARIDRAQPNSGRSW